MIRKRRKIGTTTQPGRRIDAAKLRPVYFPAMKTFWSALACAVAVIGCGTPKPADSAKEEAAASTNFVVAPSIDLIGRVTSVDAKSRFVVIAYPAASVPEKEQRLNVYRQGRKVGELKVTGPRQDNITAADILAGEVFVGDEARIN